MTRNPGRSAPPSGTVTAALEQGDLKALGAGMFNALEEPVAGQHPAIGQIVRKLEQSGALGARMTGSGSAVFGIFPEEAAAKQAAQRIRSLCRETFVTRPLARRCPGKWEE